MNEMLQLNASSMRMFLIVYYSFNCEGMLNSRDLAKVGNPCVVKKPTKLL